MEFEEKTVKSEKIFDGVLLHLVREEVLLPNGKTSVREMIRHPGAVAMIPFTSDGKMVMVRQFRKPLDRTVVEIPAGKLETSDAEPLLAAIRELEEETDYRAENWSELTVFYPTPAYLDERITIYLAEGLTKVENSLPMDEDEFIEILELTYDEAKALQESGEICDSKTIYAMLYWEMRLLRERIEG
ncbi:ADP-ribose pyrophosphatase [Trichococcus patagoniensis]|uniref:ADP-ribose pyrophosphatase n=1 Tax=Trichococcus patagoniensis TaxID=382641 RepID=A0A2T5IR47_9LACT|nr:NUDIX hydrolase [Trichococcus patagoniensis]PTQ86297.1 ADP-ribose pyrophosphatase [Trichococcus patagoniensis]